MFELWYDYVKAKYGEIAEVFYMDTGSSIVYVKTEYIFKDIAKILHFKF